ncbi:MAG TPA: TraB/GumN family protein [Burkholderiales bacterium]|nr:TraB/GumN family protein [Burkholderiales bacterium]
MNRRAFVAGMAALAVLPAAANADPFTRGLLWRVTKQGGAPSHVFGTIHDPDPRLAELPVPVRGALARSKSLMVEFLPDAYAQERFLEAALFSDRQTLEQHVGAADFARVLDELAPIGLSREFVNKLKPWGVLLNLRAPRPVHATTVDSQLVELARQRRMLIGQIEGVEEQIFTFDECPLESQVALLRHSLAHRSEILDLARRTVDAYLERDLSAIWLLREQFAARYPEIAPHQAVMTKRVLHDRSVVMAYRMQRELRRGEAFVALGALHLHGRRGVLALLEQDGYRATRVF